MGNIKIIPADSPTSINRFKKVGKVVGSEMKKMGEVNIQGVEVNIQGLDDSTRTNLGIIDIRNLSPNVRKFLGLERTRYLKMPYRLQAKMAVTRPTIRR